MPPIANRHPIAVDMGVVVWDSQSSDWRSRQQTFATQYLDGSSVSDVPVRFRWWTVSPPMGGSGIVATIWAVRMFSRMIRRVEEGTFVEVTGDRVGEARVAFRVAGGSFSTREGEGVGLVCGDLRTGGALVLETEDGPVLPVSPPVLS